MLTRCPHCHTAFRVTSEQLKVRQGRVRCGACSEVFDALDSLADEIAVSAPLPAPEPEPALHSGPGPECAPEAQPEPHVATIPAPVPEPLPDPLPEPVAIPVEEAESRPVQDGAAATATSPATATPTVVDTTPAEPATRDEMPPAWDGVAETPLPRRWPWAVGVLALLALAAGQLAYIYRVELAVLSPELRPLLVSACELAGCSVPFPHRPELVGIDSSDLEPAGGDRLLLTAMLKNRAPFVQEVPHLELTLTDTQDNALLRKVLPPADWLPAGQSATAGFAARSEIAVKLLLEAKGVPAVGYRLYLFYP